MPAYVFDKKTNELVKVAGNAANADLKDMNVYSTEEKIVGTWIDGKPIYRKVLKFALQELTQNAWNTINGVTAPSNVDVLVNAIAKRELDNSVMNIAANMDSTSISVNPFASFSINMLIVEYTKTTD